MAQNIFGVPYLTAGERHQQRFQQHVDNLQGQSDSGKAGSNLGFLLNNLFGGQAQRDKASDQAVAQTMQGDVPGENEYERQQARMAQVSNKLIELGGIENVRVAAGIRQKMALAQEERRVQMAAQNKLKADESAASMTKSEAISERADVIRKRIGTTDERPNDKRDLNNVLNELNKEQGTKASTELLGSTAAITENNFEVQKTGDLISSIGYGGERREDKEGNLVSRGVDPTKAAAIGSAVVKVSGILNTGITWAKGIAGEQEFIKAWQDRGIEFVNDLKGKIPAGQAVQLHQQIQAAVIAYARAMGGPITESDMQAAITALAASSGRLDIFYQKLAELQRNKAQATKERAQNEGAYRQGGHLQRNIDEELSTANRNFESANQLVKDNVYGYVPKGPATVAGATTAGEGRPMTDEERRKQVLGN